MRFLLMLLAFTVGVMAAGAAADAPKASDSPARGPAGPRIQVTLISDGETWVSITNVQVPTKLQTMNVSLAPGEYEVIGRRKGYRDVRKSLQVRSGTSSRSLTVVCTESISGPR